MVSNVSRVWKPDETLALVFEILLEKFITQFKTTEKNMIGHYTWQGLLLQRKSRHFLMRALIAGQIVQSKDAQCNTGELP